MAQMKMPSPSAWGRDILVVEQWVRRIHARGGRVVFVRFPTTGEHWEMEQEVYAKQLYWDRLPEWTTAETIHFLDTEGLRGFTCPDTSHIDGRDTPRFTEGLLDELVRRGVLPEE